MNVYKTNEQYYFRTSILKDLVLVEQALGWISISYETTESVFFGKRKRKAKITLTTEDSKKLIEAIQKLSSSLEASK